MLKEMKEKGEEVISSIKDKRVTAQLLNYWKTKFPENPVVKIVPDDGDLIIFQGKQIPYGDPL